MAAKGVPGSQGHKAACEIHFDKDFLKEGDFFTTSYYIDADNLQIVDNPLSIGYGPKHAGWAENITDKGWNKSPIAFGNFDWGTYKHKRIVNTKVVTAEMVGATYCSFWFLIDNWGTGTVRIYGIKVERGKVATDLE